MPDHLRLPYVALDGVLAADAGVFDDAFGLVVVVRRVRARPWTPPDSASRRPRAGCEVGRRIRAPGLSARTGPPDAASLRRPSLRPRPQSASLNLRRRLAVLRQRPVAAPRPGRVAVKSAARARSDGRKRALGGIEAGSAGARLAPRDAAGCDASRPATRRRGPSVTAILIGDRPGLRRAEGHPPVC
jgi:hypothetical protein